MTFRSSLRSLVLGTVLLAEGLAGGRALTAATADLGYYPVSSRPPPKEIAPQLLFEKIHETEIPGLPSGEPLELAPDRRFVRVSTKAGVFEVDGAGGPSRPPPGSPAASTGTPVAPRMVAAARNPSGSVSTGEVPAGGAPLKGCALGADASRSGASEEPRWLRRAQSVLGPLSACVEGPGDLIALLARDGTIYGRDRRRGHLLWRRIASHRLSDGGLAYGPYLLVAPEASRTLESLRWSDGSSAGVFRLDSEDSYFASQAIVHEGFLYILAVTTPLPDSRLLALRIHPAPGTRIDAAHPGAPAAR